MKKDLVSIKDLTPGELEDIFKLTDELKKSKLRFSLSLKGKTLALIFQKPSNRTRVSFEIGMFELGGYSIYLGPGEINLGIREAIKDVAKTLSRYVDGIVIRTFAHSDVIELAKHASIPVVNGLSDLVHPCQALADIYTIRERFQKLKDIKFVYVGDGNNVCHSLLYGCAKMGINIIVAAPKGYQPKALVLQEAKLFAKRSGAKIYLFDKPQEAVKNADVIYTDVWASMGQEKEAKERESVFKKFQINKELVAKAKKNCLIMHCLPAHRGKEITDEVIDSRYSIVFDEAENRLHVQKAVLIRLLEKR